MSDRKPIHLRRQLVLQFGFCSVFLLWSVVTLAQSELQNQVAAQVYVNPTMWPGVLILGSGLKPNRTTISEPDLKLLTVALSNKSSRVLLAVESDTKAALELSGVLHERESQITRIEPTDFCAKLNDAATLAAWENCESIWIDATPDVAMELIQLDSAAHLQLHKCLTQVLERGGFVRLTGDLSWLGTDLVKKRSMLLSNCVLNAKQSEPLPSIINIHLPEGTRCGFAKRQLINISDEQAIQVQIAATEYYDAPLEKTLKDGEAIDWVQWQRSLIERQSAMYPGSQRVVHTLANGSLVIGGGGGMPDEVWHRFVELAGGEKSRIVILPTAVEEPKAELSFEARMFKLVGAKVVKVLPHILRSEVEEKAFLDELDQATGVWFGGGRQWRFVDAYWGTAAWEKLKDVCRRGGVIGGSSAGATIQGDLLVRGAPAGNQIMIAEGYRRGLGLLPGVAIDQHFSQRNRFKELEGCLAEFPAICGIGIDEQTALVVTAPGKCSVIGTGSVWMYPSFKVTEELKPDARTRSAMRKEYKSGAEFTLESH